MIDLINYINMKKIYESEGPDKVIDIAERGLSFNNQ